MPAIRATPKIIAPQPIVVRELATPSGGGRALHRIKIQNTAALRGFTDLRESKTTACLKILFELAVMGGAAWLCSYGAAQAPWVALPGYVLACWVIATRQKSLNNMMHECAHQTFVSGAKGNEFFGQLLSFFDFSDWDAYRLEHDGHHRHLGDPEKDMEWTLRQSLLEAQGKSRAKTFLRKHVLRPLSFFHLGVYLRPVIWVRTVPFAHALLRVVILVEFVAFLRWSGTWYPFLVFYIVPYITFFQVFRYWSDSMGHVGLVTPPDSEGHKGDHSGDEEFMRSRNYLFKSQWSNLLLGGALFPRSDQYHLVHHLFPWLPSRALPRAHEHLMQSDLDYSKRSHAMDFFHDPA